MEKQQHITPDLVARHLEKSIIDGELLPGDRLPSEEKLGIQFGLSRPAVREALRILKTKALITSRSGSRSCVAKTHGVRPLRDSLEIYSALKRDGTSFLELLDFRLMVESFCVRRFVENRSVSAFERLEKKLKEMERWANDEEAFGRADIEFHLAIIEGSRHELFINLMRGLLPNIGVRFMRETYVEEGLTQKILEEHCAIFQAISVRDSVLAEKLMRRHLVNSRSHLERLIKGL